MPKVSDIIAAIEQCAPLSLQEEWDNSGLQLGNVASECHGVVACLDVTDAVIDMALKCGCNLIVSHHPLLFKGLKCITPMEGAGRLVYRCIKAGLAVYSAHTSLDNAPSPYGVSHEMASLMGAEVTGILAPVAGRADCGTGTVALLPEAMDGSDFVRSVKAAFGASGARCSGHAACRVRKVAFGGGACGFLIPAAIEAGAEAIVTSDVRYHDFLNYGDKILIVDLSHFDTEKCTNGILMRIISQKIPNFANCYGANNWSTDNPINYM